MLPKKNEKKFLKIVVAVVICLAVFVLFYFTIAPGLKNTKQKDAAPTPSGTKTKPGHGGTNDTVVKGKIHIKPEIDYQDLEKNEDLKDLMTSRKAELGIDKSLDMIVRSDEMFTIGDIKIAMSDILKQAFKKKGEIFEEKIENSGEIIPQTVKEFGIYVVQPGDNIWNIHFHILKEYYNYRGIKVEARADEPVNKGLSSGVGKILKFSESLVIIYNLAERKVDTNIDLLQPLSKIIVYDMNEVFSLLQEINYENINRIQFDGQTIWIPTEKL